MPRRVKMIREPIELAEAGVKCRDIPGFYGYQADNHGHIWSCRRHGPPYGIEPDRWRALKPKIGRKGRRCVVIVNTDGRRCEMAVAHCVLLAFVGPRPDGMEACHFPDRDPGNNCLDNLRWDTRKNNFVDRDIHGTTARGERVGRSKMTASDVRLMRLLHDRGVPYAVLVAQFGVQKSQVSRIVRRQSWAHI
jgi:hypothetical protein